MAEYVILVNEADDALGLMEKMAAHEQGMLHRAFSVFLFNDRGELLLQQRALSKYHSGGLWTNTCCSHPRDGETNLQAAQRRLLEEMGVQVPLEHRFQFIYKAHLDQGLTEHELDHVFTGTFNGVPQPDPNEVESWKWMSMDDLQADITYNPQQYTAWFKIILNAYLQPLQR
jgi:isopentenyl-diphosphate delta-isomerase